MSGKTSVRQDGVNEVYVSQIAPPTLGSSVYSYLTHQHHVNFLNKLHIPVLAIVASDPLALQSLKRSLGLNATATGVGAVTAGFTHSSGSAPVIAQTTQRIILQPNRPHFANVAAGQSQMYVDFVVQQGAEVLYLGSSRLLNDGDTFTVDNGHLTAAQQAPLLTTTGSTGTSTWTKLIQGP